MLTDIDQSAVIRGLRSGDRHAWTMLYDTYSVAVWRFVARLIGGDAAAVADVVQEVFLAAAGSAAKFDAERGTLYSWLMGIAQHQVAAHWRQASRAARLKQLAISEVGPLRQWLDSEQPLDDLLLRRELADLVRGVLAELSPDYAALLTAKYLDDRTVEEMSDELGGSSDAIKSKLARARREFRNRFEQLMREPSPTTRQ